MGNNLKNLCGQLTVDELNKVILARWAKAEGEKITRINYSFDLSNIPEQLINEVQQEANLTNGLLSLTDKSRKIVRMMLDKWQGSCGDHVLFQHVNNTSKDQKGIVFAACDQFYKASGIATFLKQPVANEGIEQFDQVLVCLPPDISTNIQIRTVAHEIGHALGLEHLHDVASIKQRLQATPQALGCSVMPYLHEIVTKENACSTAQYCGNATFSIVPGPLDEQICTKLYDRSIQIKSVGSLSSRYKYFSAMGYGLCSVGIERFLTSFISNTQFNNSVLVDKQLAQDLSLVLTTFLLKSMFKTDIPLTTVLSFAEMLARWSQFHYLNYIQGLRIMATVGMLLTVLFQLYTDDTAPMQGFYILIMLLSGVCGYSLGDTIGSAMASVASSALDATSRVGGWVGDQFNSVGNKIVNSEYGFFNKPLQPAHEPNVTSNALRLVGDLQVHQMAIEHPFQLN